MTTLGRALKRRGHRVTLIGRPDARAKTESTGLKFAVVGEKAFPLGSLARTTAELGRLSGWSAIRITGELLRRAAVTALDEASIAISEAGVDALLGRPGHASRRSSPAINSISRGKNWMAAR
jgi:UDP:flavonoid glycosyltransferase YjiC (YdhE family)